MFRQRRFLGDLDAATDLSFKQHFVESADLLRIYSNRSDIIYGAKGVGKTALRRALAELRADSYFATKIIDLDRISFSQVHKFLSDLRDTSKAEITTLARNTWRHVLSMYCLEAIFESLPDGHPLRRKLSAFLVDEGFLQTDSVNNRLVNSIEKLLTLVIEAGYEETASHSLGLTKRQISIVNDFPGNGVLRELFVSCSETITASGKVVLICLDGFDSIVDHAPESRRAIFAGLIDAIFKFSKDPLFYGSFCFKIFLPQELTEEAKTIIWDADKFINNIHYLRWSEKTFEDFIRKRLIPYSRTKSEQFQDVWREIMPDRIKNSVHGIDEYTFNYILRHTLYRPRQVLTHLQSILDQWDAVNGSLKIDPSFIPPVVAKTNYELARNVVNQLSITHPSLDVFLRSWSGSSSTIFVGDFQDRLKKIFGCQSPQEVAKLFDSLFNFGVFGVAKKPSEIKGGGRMTSFSFGFVGDRFAPNIHASVDAFDIVALSPMFHDYCGCTASEWGVVMPKD